MKDDYTVSSIFQVKKPLAMAKGGTSFIGRFLLPQQTFTAGN